MPSSLVGLRRTLSWSDFRTIPSDPPGDGDPPQDAANTSVQPTLNFAWSGDPPSIVITDGIVVRVNFDPAGSYKYSWVASWPAGDRARLLTHEQGHYDLAALLAREYFFQVVALRANTYGSVDDLNADKEAARVATIGRQQEIFDFYDTGTSHGTDASGQATWSGYVTTAFTQAATPVRPPVSGIPVMKSILDVLSDANQI